MNALPLSFSAKAVKVPHFITPPFDVQAPNPLARNVGMGFRKRPKARPAHIGILIFTPIATVLA